MLTRSSTVCWTALCTVSVLVFAHHAAADDRDTPRPPVESAPSSSEATESAAPAESQDADASVSPESTESGKPSDSVAPSEPSEPATPVEPEESVDSVEPAPQSPTDSDTARRGGFVLGVLGGPTLGWANGYPSGKSERENPSNKRSTGVGVGYRVTPFIGGALTDWFTFGLGVTFGSFSASDYSSPITSFVVHMEAFLLYGRGGIYRDIGVFVDFGTGVTTIVDKDTNEEVADSGAMSSIGLGAFWEPWRIWHLAGGPYVAYQSNRSRWFARNDITLGLRFMFYGVQP